MPTVTRFSEMSNVIAKIVNVKSRDFMLYTWTDLVEHTPVKTGKARASWFVSPGSPKTKEIPDGTYGYPPLPNLDVYTRNWTKWFIANTAPYIADLNAGSSKQAPAGFIQTSLQRSMVRYG